MCNTGFSLDSEVYLGNNRFVTISNIPGVFISDTNRQVEIFLINANSITVTDCVEVKTSLGYKLVSELVIGDKLLSSNMEEFMIHSFRIDTFEEPWYVYILDNGGKDLQIGEKKILFKDCSFD